MTLAAQKKKTSEKELLALLTKVQKLEAQHKLTAAIIVADDLALARKELQARLDLQAKQIIFFRRGFFYKLGNKGGKFFS